jgi:hypothetical protein
MFAVVTDISQKMHEMGLLSRLIKHGYDKALSYARGNAADTEFVTNRQGYSAEKLISEYNELVKLLQSS